MGLYRLTRQLPYSFPWNKDRKMGAFMNGPILLVHLMAFLGIPSSHKVSFLRGTPPSFLRGITSNGHHNKGEAVQAPLECFLYVSCFRRLFEGNIGNRRGGYQEQYPRRMGQMRNYEKL